jgi:hypothetical protein
MTKEEIHPAVELFIARAKSHPDEIYEGRWDWAEGVIMRRGTEEEKKLVNEALREAELNEMHKSFMQKLLGGEQKPEVEEVVGEPVVWDYSNDVWHESRGIDKSAGAVTLPMAPLKIEPATITTVKTPLKVDGYIEHTGTLRKVRKEHKK